jgi:hypothetical protein
MMSLKFRYLAKTTGSNISILITYIVFLTKLQKGESPRKGFALFKNDITTFELASRLQISVTANSQAPVF